MRPRVFRLLFRFVAYRDLRLKDCLLERIKKCRFEVDDARAKVPRADEVTSQPALRLLLSCLCVIVEIACWPIGGPLEAHESWALVTGTTADGICSHWRFCCLVFFCFETSGQGCSTTRTQVNEHPSSLWVDNVSTLPKQGHR